MNNDKVIQAIAPIFTELMTQKIQNLATDWQQPWVTATQGRPRNLSGRNYHGGNILTLLILTEEKGYKAPVFLSFKQAKEADLNICKGEKGFPVFFWYRYAVPTEPNLKGMPYEKYLTLSAEDQKRFKILFPLRYYTVFNIDQTDMQKKNPQRYEQLTTETRTNDYSCEVIDRMIDEEKWYCPIELKKGNQASYYPNLDRIVCPLKTQFPQGRQFYATLLHEIAHSTGHAGRLNRNQTGGFGSPNYAREELIAELTAALCGVIFGFATVLQEENAAYLKSWLEALAQEPKYLFNILTDVNKAATLITDKATENSDSQTTA